MARRYKDLSPEARERQIEAQKRWHKENYDIINLSVPKGMKARYSALAEAHGLALSTYVRKILDAEYENTFGTKPE